MIRLLPTVLFGSLMLACILSPVAVQAAEVTLKVHHFLPATSVAHAEFLVPWAKAVEEQSDGRIRVRIFPAMQLGGKPPQLFDQIRDGVTDLGWTLAGYTPGRFPTIEVIEPPFMTASAEATSQAAHAFYELHAAAELAGVKPLLVHVHAPGSLHMRGKPVQRLEDMQGAKVRAPTRVTNRVVKLLGATPVGMPAPQVPEALSKGVIDGAILPFEVARPLRVHELTDSHTDFGGSRGLYTAVFLFAMNKDRYASLPADLKQVIDDNSGLALAKRIGRVWDTAEIAGREAAMQLSDAFYHIEGAELEHWRKATEPAIDTWVRQMDARGANGRALLDEARRLVTEYAGD